MPHGCRHFRTCWRVTFAVLVAIGGFASNTHGQTSYQVVAAFDPPSSRGANPDGGLVEGSDGSFYGITSAGGAAGYGAIFKFDAAGNLTLLHSFNYSDGAYPHGTLIQASDGSFYGTTFNGGASYGTIFKFDAAGTLTVLHSFNYSDGAYPYGTLIQASDGAFYGTRTTASASQDVSIATLPTARHRLADEGEGLMAIQTAQLDDLAI